MLRSEVVVQVSRDSVKARDLSSGRTSSASGAFTTTRLLVGNFPVADEALKRAFRELHLSGFKRLSVFVHQLEMAEGGLSAVEERVLLELAAGVGATRALAYAGPPLSDQEISNRLQAVE